MDFKNLLIEQSEGIAILTINRPQSLNALNFEVITELGCALKGLEDDPTVKVVIMTGAGEKAFVAGGDIKVLAAFDSCQAHAFAQFGQEMMLAISRMKKPVIAAVNGFALGGGLELALACDFIYASESARFGMPEVTLGVIPGFGGTQNLARQIGASKARELIFSGRMISAQQACAWGIVNEIYSAEELMAKTIETAKTIAGTGLLAVSYAKAAVNNGLNMSKDDGCRYEASLFAVLFSSDDLKEGMSAFTAKRKAEFKGLLH